MQSTNDSVSSDNSTARSPAQQVFFWVGFVGLLLGFVVFTLLMSAMLILQLTEGDSEVPTLRQIAYVIYIFARHGIPLLVWFLLRRRLAIFGTIVTAVLALGCWAYSVSFLYVLVNPVQW